MEAITENKIDKTILRRWAYLRVYNDIPGITMLNLKEVSLILNTSLSSLREYLRVKSNIYRPSFAKMFQKEGKEFKVMKRRLEHYLTKNGGVNA